MIFKYLTKQYEVSEVVEFTFQSGDIQIIPFFSISFTAFEIYIPIWWYSNQIMWIFTTKHKYNLHSNLVIFKSKQQIRYSFVEHYLHSNLVIFKSSAMYKCTISTDTFTFQSGDIQIQHLNLSSYCSKNIYIPIWWYSNLKKRKKSLLILTIYIPIWWYSNIFW